MKIMPTVFKDGEPINIKKISVPEGYRAKSAWITYVLSDETQVKLKGFVGQKQFDIPGLPNQPLQMNNEDLAIPVCVMCSADPTLLPLPSNQQSEHNLPIKYSVNIEVECTLNPEKFEEWQIQTYNAILEGYRQQKAEYYERAGVGQTEIRSHNPLENRKIEKNELKKGCTKQLFQQYFKLVGNSDEPSEDGNPSPFAVNFPRYIQFFEQAFEWHEMTYHFYQNLEEEVNQDRLNLRSLNYYSETDPLFTSFLQAGTARVLVPVRSDYATIVLYYLSSGTIWPGENSLTPTNEKYVSLVNELKILPQVDCDCKSVSKPWIITIPTSMIMLQDSSKLPQFSVNS